MNRILLKISLIVSMFIYSFIASAQTQPNERPFVKISNTNIMDGGDLCPKSSSVKYNHHFVLIDATSALRKDQMDWIKRMLFSKSVLDQMVPWDRLTIMRLGGTQPSSNKPLFSKCRPRNGDEKSNYKLDKHNSFNENKSELENVYNKLFIGGINDALRKIEAQEYDDPVTNQGSPILEQIKEISRLPDLGFNARSGYETRRLTIVSDLAQNSERLPFYELCPGTKKCPSWDKFKRNKKYKIWAKKIEPKFGANMSLDLMYLNTFFDQQVDKKILEFWMEYFTDNGIPLDDWNIESSTGAG